MRVFLLILAMSFAALPCIGTAMLQKIEATIEHELTYEKDTLLVYSYHRMPNGEYYLKLTTGKSWFVDRVKPISDTIIYNWCY